MLNKRFETTNFPSYKTISNNASGVPFEFPRYSLTRREKIAKQG